MALAALCGAPLVHAADTVRVVSVEFIPTLIARDATSTLRVELRNNGAGGQRASIDYPLIVPSGLTAVGHRLGQDCNAAAVTFLAEGSTSGVNLIGLTLLPSGTCTVDVTVSAAEAGTYTFTAQSNGTTLSTALTVVAPVVAESATLRVSQTAIPFPPQEVGVTSTPRLVTLSNPGGPTVTITGILASSPFATTSECATAVLISGAECTFAITFTPMTPGPTEGGFVQITSNAITVTITLSGDGITPMPMLSPVRLSFPPTAVNTTATAHVTLTNHLEASAALTVGDFDVSGPFSATSNCPPSLAVGDACRIDVTYLPTTIGEHAGQLKVWSLTEGSSVVLPLSGTSEAPAVPGIALSPGSLGFGSQTIGTASTTQAVTITSSGTAALNIAAIVASGDFNFTGCATPLTLDPGTACTLSIKFLPTAGGVRSGAITISSNATGSPHAVSLSGTGTIAPVPAISATPASANFGSVIVGASATARVAISNTGEADLAISAISVDGPHFLQSHTCPGVLSPAATCNVVVTYSPAVVGAHSGALRITSNAAPSTLAIPLAGNALPVPVPAMQLSSTRLAFDLTFVSTVSSPRPVTVTNAGTGPMHISSIVTTGDFGYSGCGFPSTIPAGGSCLLSITFRPLAGGPLEGSIQIVSDAPGSPHIVVLSGEGALALIPAISLAPAALDFGTLRVGTDEMSVMRLTNAGNMALSISAISSAGAMFSQANNCPASLAAAAFCDIEVTYAPTSAGAHSGQVRISSNATPSEHIAAVSGTAIPVPPAFMVVETFMDFGQQLTGSVTRAALAISNTGGRPLVISQMQIFGAPEFGVEGSCAVIEPKETCSVMVLFAPTVAGALGGRIEIVSNHSAGMVSVELVGQGIARPRADIELSIDGLGFGNQVVGSVSDTRPVGVTNVGNAPLQIIGFDLPLDFQVNSRQCPAQLAPEASCELLVTFKPVVPGPRGGQLTINSNAIGGPASISLTGTGCRFFTMGAARNPQRLCAP